MLFQRLLLDGFIVSRTGIGKVTFNSIRDRLAVEIKIYGSTHLMVLCSYLCRKFKNYNNRACVPE